MDECVRASEQPVRKKKRIVGQEQGGVYTTVDSAVEETGKFGVFKKKKILLYLHHGSVVLIELLNWIHRHFTLIILFISRDGSAIFSFSFSYSMNVCFWCPGASFQCQGEAASPVWRLCGGLCLCVCVCERERGGVVGGGIQRLWDSFRKQGAVCLVENRGECG